MLPESTRQDRSKRGTKNTLLLSVLAVLLVIVALWLWRR